MHFRCSNEVNIEQFLPLCSKTPSELIGKRIVMFSYGSGLASCMYSLRMADTPQLYQLTQSMLNVPKTLAARKTIPPADFEATMKLREETHHLAPYKPVGDPTQLFPGTYYLTGVDEKHRRSYVRVPPAQSTTKGEVQLKSPLAQIQQTLSNGAI